MSFGIHHLWRKKLVSYSGAKPGDSVLDCATGTGDLAIEFKKKVKSGRVVGTDFCKEMLAPAPGKAQKKQLDIEFAQADVTHLNYKEDEFDISSISFGIRNVEEPLKAMKELARVTRSGGVVMVLEFGQPDIIGFRQVYNLYSELLLPRIGGLVSGSKESYEYLQTSSSKFPCRQEFVDFVLSCNSYSSGEYKSLSGGIAYMYKFIVK